MNNHKLNKAETEIKDPRVFSNDQETHIWTTNPIKTDNKWPEERRKE